MWRFYINILKTVFNKYFPVVAGITILAFLLLISGFVLVFFPRHWIIGRSLAFLGGLLVNTLLGATLTASTWIVRKYRLKVLWLLCATIILILYSGIYFAFINIHLFLSVSYCGNTLVTSTNTNRDTLLWNVPRTLPSFCYKLGRFASNTNGITQHYMIHPSAPATWRKLYGDIRTLNTPTDPLAPITWRKPRYRTLNPPI